MKNTSIQRLRASAWLTLALCSGVVAAPPSYTLTCVPPSSDMSLGERLKARLELHGWQEGGKPADYRLCFRLLNRQQLQSGPGMAYPYGPYPGAYWNAPSAQVINIPYLDLTATRTDGSVWQAQQDLPSAERPALGIEQGARILIDKLPLE